MNKKEYKKAIFLFLLFLLVLASIFSIVKFTQSTYDNACKEIGFKEQGEYGSISTCKDYEGNLHYVEFTEYGFFGVKAKEISVGGVFIK